MAEKISTKKAVIATGGKQYIVSEGDELEVELLNPSAKAIFDTLLVIDGGKTTVGNPNVTGVSVNADVLDQVVKGEKVVAIRFKSKKRVSKVRGHRQKYTRIKITKIGAAASSKPNSTKSAK